MPSTVSGEIRLKPAIMKQYAEFWKKGKRIYAGAGLSALIGVIFLAAASQCAVAWVIKIFGILALAKGIALFALKPEKSIAMIDWWMGRPPELMRFMGIVAIAIGALLIYAV